MGNPYETQKLLWEYLLLHYGGEEELSHPELPVEKAVTALPFPVRYVRELLDASLLPSDAIALEAGCSVGASSFELARYCSFVEAGDFSNSFIAAAKVLQSEGEIVAQRILEGEITTRFVATVSSGIDRNRVKFSLQDAMNLPEGIGPFDVLLAANLLCRLPDPDAFLHRAASLVKPGGQLLLTTPFTWLEEYTPRDRWIGGIDPERRSQQELALRLSGEFRLHRRRDLPFLIREHERKYQLGIALGTCWIKN